MYGQIQYLIFSGIVASPPTVGNLRVRWRCNPKLGDSSGGPPGGHRSGTGNVNSYPIDAFYMTMIDLPHLQRAPTFRECSTTWRASSTKWYSRPTRGRWRAWPASHVTNPTHGKWRPALDKWQDGASHIWRESTRGYISLSAESTLRLGRSRPIVSGNMELGAAKSPHQPPQGGGEE